MKKGLSFHCILQSGPFHSPHPFPSFWRVGICKVCPKEVLGFDRLPGNCVDFVDKIVCVTVDPNFVVYDFLKEDRTPRYSYSASKQHTPF
jgi:hypothetical protein